MSASEDYCELCDLPRSQCVHGRPPPPPPAKKAAVKPPPRARKQPATKARTTRATTTTRRWTPPEAFQPLILDVLRQAGGELEADELFLELQILAEDRLLPGDSETTPTGELRWQYAARRARMALIEEGLMIKGRPGVWELAPSAQGLG